MGTSLRVLLGREHFGVFIHPSPAASVRAGYDEVEHVAVAEQQVLDRGEKLGRALTRQRRYADRMARTAAVIGVGERRPILLAQEIDLVRDLEDRVRGTIEAELRENILERPGVGPRSAHAKHRVHG